MARHFYFLFVLVLLLYCCAGAGARETDRACLKPVSKKSYLMYCASSVRKHMRSLHALERLSIERRGGDTLVVDRDYLEDIHCVVAGLIQLGLTEPERKAFCFSHAALICDYENDLLDEGQYAGRLKVSSADRRRARVLLGCFYSVIDREQSVRTAGLVIDSGKDGFFAREYKAMVLAGIAGRDDGFVRSGAGYGIASVCSGQSRSSKY